MSGDSVFSIRAPVCLTGISDNVGLQMKPMRKQIIIWATILLALALIFQGGVGDKSQNEPWAYSRFLEEVSAGRVREVVLDEGKILILTTHGESMITFAPEHPALVDLLITNNVVVKTKPVRKSLLFFQFLTWIPAVLLLVWLLFLFRQSQGGGPGAMSFGKVRAKMATAKDSLATFKDVAGVDEAKEELVEVVDFLKDPKRFQKLGGRIPKGVLLVGPPGTGKTLLARAVAGEAGRPFFAISGSSFVEMFVGVGASRVRDLFEQAKKRAPCIIFIDELDAVGRSRGAGLGGGHDEREQTLNQLLVEMDGFTPNQGVILIAATNRPDVLDTALLRPGRFDRRVVVDLPDILGREAILNLHAKKVVLSKDVDLKILARRTPGFSGADLANLINEAALLSGRRSLKSVGPIEMEESIDRVMAGPERKSRVLSDKERKTVAFHEAGHALVARLTPNTNPVHKISIIPRGHGALGYTLQVPTEDRFLSTKTEILAELTVLLGGRASEELVFSEISTGASNDFEKVSEIARRMVCQYGMSERIGTLSLGRGNEAIFLGRDLGREKDYSEATAMAIDEEITKVVKGAHKRALALLRTNRKLLDNLAEALLERETIEAHELDVILGLKQKKRAPAKKARPKVSPKARSGKVASSPPPVSASAPAPAPATAVSRLRSGEASHGKRA